MEFEPHQTVACGDSGNDIGAWQQAAVVWRGMC